MATYTKGKNPKPSTSSVSEKVESKTKKELICSLVKKKTKQKFLSESQKKIL